MPGGRVTGSRYVPLGATTGAVISIRKVRGRYGRSSRGALLVNVTIGALGADHLEKALVWVATGARTPLVSSGRASTVGCLFERLPTNTLCH